METTNKYYYNQDILDHLLKTYGLEDTRTFCLLNAAKHGYLAKNNPLDPLDENLYEASYWLEKANEIGKKIANLNAY